MTPTVIGFSISVVVLFLLSRLFAYEEARGRRFLEGWRTHADFFVLKVSFTLKGLSRFLGRDFIRQVAHYIFHTILRFILRTIRVSERGLSTMMQVNRTLAKNAERESKTRTMLEEVALHKVETALTEKEKNAHKKKMLEG